MGGELPFRAFVGELGPLGPFVKLYLDRRHLRDLLKARAPDDVLILQVGGLRIELSAHRGIDALVAAAAVDSR